MPTPIFQLANEYVDGYAEPYPAGEGEHGQQPTASM